jgi:hypothetical protein
MKIVISIVFAILMTKSSVAQKSVNWSLYGELRYNTIFNSESPAIKHMPHTISRWNVLDGNRFTADEKEKPLYYRLPLSVEIGVLLKTRKQNTLTLGLNYNHFGRTDTLGSKLRYSDMLDERHGFVNPSNYTLEGGYHIYRTIGFDVDYLFEDGIGSYTHRLGLGFGVQRLLGSRYFLNHFHDKTKEHSDYSDKDLSLSDRIWIFNPKVSYQGNIYATEKLKYWVVSSFAFNVQEKYEKEPIGHILSFGLRAELQ